MSITLRMTTEADRHLPAFDHTKLSAINSCPRYGILRYAHHKEIASAQGLRYRNMALEAGTVMHQCFSAIRLWQLGYAQNHMPLMHHHGTRLFGVDRWAQISNAMMDGGIDDAPASLRSAALETLSTSGFIDDDGDKRRTYSNLETSLLYYTQRWDHARYPVWVREPDNALSDVGIEIAFDMVIEHDGVSLFRYTGRVDGIHTDTNGELLIQENKTASRLGTAWRMAFNTSHQVTGYCVAASVFTHAPVSRALVLGVSIPLPRTLSEGLAIEPVTRPTYAVTQWLAWLLHTVQMHDAHVNDPLSAPMYSHSCNRYFSPCSMIPLCAADADEQRLILSEMAHSEWSPLNEAH